MKSVMVVLNFLVAVPAVAQEELVECPKNIERGREELYAFYKGILNDVVNHILGGLRSACTYVGADKLKNLSKCTTFVQVNGGKTYNPYMKVNSKFPNRCYERQCT